MAKTCSLEVWEKDLYSRTTQIPGGGKTGPNNYSNHWLFIWAFLLCTSEFTSGLWNHNFYWSWYITTKREEAYFFHFLYEKSYDQVYDLYI